MTAILTLRALLTALRTWRSVRAAQALVGVHLGSVYDRLDVTAERAEATAATSERVGRAGADLARSASDLRLLLDAVPRERARLRRVVLDTLLPTDGDSG